MNAGDYMMVSIPGAVKPDLNRWKPALDKLWDFIDWHQWRPYISTLRTKCIHPFGLTQYLGTISILPIVYQVPTFNCTGVAWLML